MAQSADPSIIRGGKGQDLQGDLNRDRQRQQYNEQQVDVQNRGPAKVEIKGQGKSGCDSCHGKSSEKM